MTFKDDVEMIIPARPPSLYQLVQLSQDQEESFDLDDGQWVPGQSASVNSVMAFIGYFLGKFGRIIVISVVKVGSDTLDDPIFQKGLQN